MVINVLLVVVFSALFLLFIVCIVLTSKLAKGVGELVSLTTEIQKKIIYAENKTVKLIKTSEKYTPKGIIKTIGTIIIDTLMIKHFNPFKKA